MDQALQKRKDMLKTASDVICIVVFLVSLLRINTYLFAFLPLSLIYQIAVILSLVLVPLRFYLEKCRLRKDQWLLLAFFTVLAVSTLINRSTFSRNSITMLVDTYAYLFLFYFYASTEETNRLRKWVFRGFLTACSILAALALLVYFTNIRIQWLGGYVIEQTWNDPYFQNRLNNILVQPNQGALHSLICLILCGFAAWKKRADKKSCIGFCMLGLLHLIVIVLAQSRTIYLIMAALAALLVLHVMKQNSRSQKWVQPLVYAALAAFILLIAFKMRNGVHENQGGIAQMLNGMTTGRISLWKYVLQNTKGLHILFGSGIASFRFQSTIDYSVNPPVPLYLYNAHNLFFDTYFRSGIIGTVLLIAFFIGHLRKMRTKSAVPSSTDTFSLKMVCIALFLFSMIDCGILFLSKGYNIVFWFALGCLYYDSSCGQKNPERTVQ